jgi:hypothetical protein
MSSEYITSGFENLPIPLGLALETVIEEVEFRIDKKRTKPTSQLLSSIELIHFDIYTLVKDLISSYEDITRITVEDIVQDLEVVKTSLMDLPELQGISTLFNSYRHYESFIRTPMAFGATVNMTTYRDGTKVKLKSELLHKVMKLQKGYVDTVETGNTNLLYTHNNVYLALMARRAKRIIVLEHHTGNVLDEKSLNKKIRKSTKYDTSNMPFNLEMIQVFGDNDICKGMSNVNKTIVMELIERWTPTTNYKVVQHQINGIKSKFIN